VSLAIANFSSMIFYRRDRREHKDYEVHSGVVAAVSAANFCCSVRSLLAVASLCVLRTTMTQIFVFLAKNC
jgi:hypothetical protein